MNFGEKLYQLRKEQGLSQEALSEQLNTTRQAVSKWENNQGYPETEKLMQLSSLFGVSIDYLLKEQEAASVAGERGFYVSREAADGYLANAKIVARYAAIGLACCLLGGIPYSMLASDSGRIIGMAACIAVGICIFMVGALKEDTSYDVLKREPLLFDPQVLRELTAAYAQKQRKYHVVTACSLCCLVLGLSAVIVFRRIWSYPQALQAVAFLLLALGALGLTFTCGQLEPYALLVKNSEHCERFSFRLRRRVKHKIDRL